MKITIELDLDNQADLEVLSLFTSRVTGDTEVQLEAAGAEAQAQDQPEALPADVPDPAATAEVALAKRVEGLLAEAAKIDEPGQLAEFVTSARKAVEPHELPESAITKMRQMYQSLTQNNK